MEKIKLDLYSELKESFNAIYLSTDEQGMVIVELDFKETVEDKQLLLDCIGVEVFKEFMPEILGAKNARCSFKNGIQVREYKGDE